jgi:hypothetical protein
MAKPLFLLLICCVVVGQCALGAETAKPNLVVINIDDLGYADIGPFGSNNKTPNLDRMAAEGRKLTSHYAAPVCSPSRAALMTGCYPKRVLPIPGVLFPAAAVGLNPDETTVAEILKDAGYATACVGKWHLGDQPEFLPTRQGFDYYFGIPYSNDMGPAFDGAKSNVDKPLPTREEVAAKATKAKQHQRARPESQASVSRRFRCWKTTRSSSEFVATSNGPSWSGTQIKPFSSFASTRTRCFSCICLTRPFTFRITLPRNTPDIRRTAWSAIGLRRSIGVWEKCSMCCGT